MAAISQGQTLTDPKTQKRKPKIKPSNLLQAGLVKFIQQQKPLNGEGSAWQDVEDLLSRLPKRYTLYPPLLLLPANVFIATSQWKEFYTALSPAEKKKLYACLADAFRGQGSGVTHIAINAPIAAELERKADESSSVTANVMRSPTGLVPLYGDWGPRHLLARADSEGLVGTVQPTREDFQATFWASAVQNGGVVQVWAPVWTMFSRGNIKEKARILGEGAGPFDGLDCGFESTSFGQELHHISVVDLFVGIGYFAFSYLRRGVGLIWGWEINGWSIEGLRRGCKRNGWRVEVLKVVGDGQVVDEQGRVGNAALQGLAECFDTVFENHKNKEKVRCVVFHGENKWSKEIMSRLEDIALHRQMNEQWKRVRHVNLGLLPHARDSWQTSVRIIDSKIGGWLHIHEIVDVIDLQSRKVDIVRAIDKLVATDVSKCGQWETSCCHLEEVKTYAPGVMHCVFDIQILPAK